jgi:hypothetical protein
MKTIDFNDNLTLTFTGPGKVHRDNEIWIRTQVFNKQLNLPDTQYFAFKLPVEMTDGASIPWYGYLLITPFDWRILNPSQPHDHMYAMHLLRYKDMQADLAFHADLYERKHKLIEGVIWDKRTGEVVRTGVVIPYTRKDSDRILTEKMRSYGGGPFLRAIVYTAVRVGGFRAFYKNK